MDHLIETERLRMRLHRPDDLAASTQMWRSPAVYRYISGKPGSREECRARLLRFAGHWTLDGFGYWVVEDRLTKGFIGEVGFSDFMRDMTPSTEGTMEAGWVLSPPHHGRGYGAEAVMAAIGWARANFPERSLTCLIDPDNAPSIALAKKCGFVQRCVATYRDKPALLFDWRDHSS